MEKFKKKINDFIDMLPYLILQFLHAITLGLILLITYWISISDLPNWFKFFLLS
jgi:hypothetical protein